MENWKDIKNYEGIYQVSDMGNVRNVKRNKNLKPSVDSHGYARVFLYKNNVKETAKIHRLVALHFLENPENKEDVDHVNTVKTDNRVSNLKWATHKENMRNKLTQQKLSNKDTDYFKLKYISKRVRCITTGEEFDSALEAAKHYDIKDKFAVSNAANPNHKTKTAGKLPDGTKLEWKYINKEKSFRRIKCITANKEFNSVTDASKYYNVSITCICNACIGKQKTAGKLPDGTKLKWEYMND